MGMVQLSLAAIVFLLGVAVPARAEIVFDGTTGSGPLSGPDYVIPAEFGTRPGDGPNLFHSFLVFNLFTNGGISESATFTGPNGIENILAAVTGGSPSWINGLLRSTIQGADLYFLNPAGVLMGSHAEIDIQGSFYLSNADYVRLGASGRFDASNPSASILTAEPPEAFGFLGPAAGAIQVFESQLGVPDGESITLVGGQILTTGGPSGRIDAPGGRIDLVGTASAGEVEFDPADRSLPLDTSSFSELGDVAVDYLSYLNTSSDTGAGTIFIRGRDVLVGDSFLLANSEFDSGSPVGIDIGARRDLAIREDSLLQSGADWFADGSTLLLQAGRHLEVEDSELSTISVGFGSGGDVAILADVLVLDLASIMTESASERSGNVSIVVGDYRQLNGSSIRTGTIIDGQAGDVSIEARRSAVIQGSDFAGESVIDAVGRSQIPGYASGSGGAIEITTPELLLDDALLLAFSEGDGTAGTITLSGGRLTAEEGSLLVSGTRGPGPGGGGSISIEMDDSVLFTGGSGILNGTESNGDAGPITVAAPIITLIGDSLIANNTQGSGNAGPIRIQARHLTLQDGFGLSTLSSADATGDAGPVEIVATRSVTLSGESAGPESRPSGILSTTSGEGDAGEISIESPQVILDAGAVGAFSGGGTGNAADITFLVSELVISNGGSVSGGSTGSGAGANITIEADQSVLLSSDGGSSTGVFNGVLGSGNAGRVSIRTPEMTISGPAVVESQTLGSGAGGVVAIEVDRLRLEDGGAISSATASVASGGSGPSGPGGSVLVNAAESVAIVGSSGGLPSSIVSASDSEGPAGTIWISTGRLEMDQGLVTTKAFRSGAAGAIEVDADQIQMRNDARIDSSTEAAGRGGDIRLTAGTMEMSDSTVSVLSEGTADAGRIELAIGDTLELVDSSVSAEALEAFGGSIVVSVGRLLRMTGSTISSTVLGGAGDGGNVTLDTEFVILDDSRIIAQAERGAGGNILVTADVLIVDPESLISASSRLGIDGEVDLRTPDANLAGSLAKLPESFLDAAALMKDRCAARRSDSAGSFFVGGRGAIPASPDGFLPAPHPVTSGPLRSTGTGAYLTGVADGSSLVYLVDCTG